MSGCPLRAYWWEWNKERNVPGSQYSGNCQEKVFRGQREPIPLSEAALKKPLPREWLNSTCLSAVARCFPGYVKVTTYARFHLHQQCLLPLADILRGEWDGTGIQRQNSENPVVLMLIISCESFVFPLWLMTGFPGDYYFLKIKGIFRAKNQNKTKQWKDSGFIFE